MARTEKVRAAIEASTIQADPGPIVARQSLWHTWRTDSAVHRGEGARCGGAPCAALEQAGLARRPEVQAHPDAAVVELEVLSKLFGIALR